MTRFLAAIGDRIQRYPVLFFGAAAAWAKSKLHIETGTADDAALTATVLWLQSAWSVSKKTAEERVDAAKADAADKASQATVDVDAAKYVGALEHQAVTLAAQVPPPRPLRAKPDPEAMPSA